jgi:hypothetical protein
MTDWIYDGKPISPEFLFGYYGFVYEIENVLTGRKYIGKKLLWFKKTKMVKGKKKRYLKESDWRTYWGSNNALLEDIEKHGEQNFKRTILCWCKSKGECSYMEAKYQFERSVLIDSAYYNDLIRCRIHSKHIKDEKKAPSGSG